MWFKVYFKKRLESCFKKRDICTFYLCALHRKKRFTSFPSPAGMSLTKLPLGRNNSVMTSLFPPRESLLVTSRLGKGNSRTFFYGVQYNECISIRILNMYNTLYYMYCKYCSTMEIRDSSIASRDFPVFIGYQNRISISHNRKHYIHI
jgi:hypothetical protein